MENKCLKKEGFINYFNNCLRKSWDLIDLENRFQEFLILKNLPDWSRLRELKPKCCEKMIPAQLFRACKSLQNYLPKNFQLILLSNPNKSTLKRNLISILT